MKIRSDLDGVVYVQSEGGVVCLSAGDTVPDGVDVGQHLTSETKEPTETPEVEETEQPEAEQSETKEPTETPEVEETENAGRRRGRRSTPRPDADD